MTEATGMAVYATDDNPLILVRRFTWLPKAIILICRGQTFTRWNMHFQVLKAFICLTYKQLKDRLVLLYVLVQTPLLTTTGEERSTKTPKTSNKGNNFWNGLPDNRLFTSNILTKAPRIISFAAAKYHVKNAFSNLILWIKIKHFAGFFIYTSVHWSYSLP